MKIRSGVSTLSALVLISALCPSAKPDKDRMSSEQRDAAFTMLKSVHDIVKAEYYDPRFRGVDIDARYKTAKEKLADVATLSESYGLAAWFLEPLNDSHTVFIPPARPYRIENGWRMKCI